MCEAMDTEVGRLLAGVNLTETTVIFIGDNGTPSTVIQTPYSAAHSKGTLYDGGVRVPLIIAGKGVVSPNRTSTQPVHCVDLYSTILELAGINVSATQPAGNPIDSVSLLPILQNSTAASRYLFVEQFSADLATNVSGQAVIDEAGYKLIQFDDGHEEFYKTSTDTNEATTLLGNVGITSTDQAAFAALKLQLPAAMGISTPDTPLISSWFTQDTGEYARIYPTLADQLMQEYTRSTTRRPGCTSTPQASPVTSWGRGI
jgi:arylsulfatase A-like enzyme